MRNPYIPKLAVIEGIKEETPDIKTFRVRLRDGDTFDYLPGQFVELTVFGYGEFPTSISSSPLPQKDFLELTVRRVGDVTNALHRLQEGSIIGLRGPYGNGFPVEKLRGRDILIVSGGCGLAPLRSLILYLKAKKEEYGEITLLYGARTPKDIVFKDEIEKWGIRAMLTVDKADDSWGGDVGLVTVLCPKVRINSRNTWAVLCGPPIMMSVMVNELKKMGVPPTWMILSLERLMKCGIGMCGHCNIGAKYVCKDGPVFFYEEARGFLEF